MPDKPEWTLNSLADRSYAIAQDKGWEDRPCSTVERLALIHSEVSEALEELRNGHAEAEVYYDAAGKPCGVGIELMDAVFRILHLLRREGLDANELAWIKTRYNETRPYRHGGKKL